MDEFTKIPELTPEKKKVMLLMAIDGMRKKVENHTIGDMRIELDEKTIPIYLANQREPKNLISEGFCYTIEVRYLDPTESEV